jgi:hypothetical protein
MARRPVRIPTDLVEAARAAGQRSGRSVPDQVEHWVKVGMELERSPTVTHRAIEELLASGQATASRPAGATAPGSAVSGATMDAG